MTRLRRSSADPYGIGPLRPLVAPIAALVGLFIVAVLTFDLLNGQLPVPGSGNGGGGTGPILTPAPSNVVIVEPEVVVPGTIVYAKAGNIWVQSGKNAHQVTTSNEASMPAWSPDGQWIYYIDTVPGRGYYPAGGAPRHYDMTVPNLMRVHPDGTGTQRLATGQFSRGKYTWFYWLRQPEPSPDGRTIALLSDGPDPQASDVVLQFFDLKTKKLTKPRLGENAPLGHQDPAWRQDGKILLYVKDARDGPRGAPVIYRFDPASGRESPVTQPGYMQPSWSPDSRYIAATKTDGLGTDVVILDATSGAELLRITTDGLSWAPTWSPKGDAIAFLHINNAIVDLRMATLEGTAPSWTLGKTIDLTKVSGLDGGSRPDWYIPPDQLPSPPPSTAPSVAPTATGSGAAPSQ